MKNLKTKLIQTNNEIVNMKNSDIANAISINNQQVVQPHFAEIDKKRDLAISKINEQARNDIAKINQDVDKAKKDFAETQKAIVTNKIETSYKNILDDIDRQIQSISEE